MYDALFPILFPLHIIMPSWRHPNLTSNQLAYKVNLVPQMSFTPRCGGSRFCCQIITVGLLISAEFLKNYSNVSTKIFLSNFWVNQMVLSIIFSKRHQEMTCFAMAQAGTHPSVKIDLIQRYGWPWIPARANCHLNLRPCAHFSEGHHTFLKPYGWPFYCSPLLSLYFTVFPLSLTSGKVLNKTLHFPLTLFFCFSFMNWSHCLCEILVNMLVWIDSTCRWVLPLHKS